MLDARSTNLLPCITFKSQLIFSYRNILLHAVETLIKDKIVAAHFTDNFVIKLCPTEGKQVREYFGAALCATRTGVEYVTHKIEGLSEKSRDIKRIINTHMPIFRNI